VAGAKLTVESVDICIGVSGCMAGAGAHVGSSGDGLASTAP
jgi:hypothetical protein